MLYPYFMIIDGKKIAEKHWVELAERVKKLQKSPKLAAVLVGDIGSSKKFLELKKTAAEKIGINCKIYEFAGDITTQNLRKEIVKISKVSTNDAVIVELPLPSQINKQYILNAIPQDKDVDVLSEKSQGSFWAGRSAIYTPAVEALNIIFEDYSINLKGKNCVIFGYGLLVGKPISHWLSERGATVSVINEFTINPVDISRKADIIISGVGKANLVKSDMVKDEVVVIDFGYENSMGKMVGDVDFGNVSKKASLITPVPGGIGPLVVLSVFKNLVKMIEIKNER